MKDFLNDKGTAIQNQMRKLPLKITGASKEENRT